VIGQASANGKEIAVEISVNKDGFASRVSTVEDTVIFKGVIQSFHAEADILPQLVVDPAADHPAGKSLIVKVSWNSQLSIKEGNTTRSVNKGRSYGIAKTATNTCEPIVIRWLRASCRRRLNFAVAKKLQSPSTPKTILLRCQLWPT
jgi:hypothetical protein